MRRPPVALVLLAGLTACGGEGSAGPATPVTTSSYVTVEVDAPPVDYLDCEVVWVAGLRLPADYDGCYDAVREVFVAAAPLACADGTALTSYRDRWWALGAGPVAEALGGETATDPAYAEDYWTCSP